MANKMRHRYGEKNVIQAPVNTLTTIEIGDLLVLNDTDSMLSSTYPITADYYAYPFSDLDSTNAAAEEALASDHFLGVAMQASAAGETDKIRVATDGVFEFPLDTAATCELMGQVEPTSGATAVKNQEVVAGTTDPIGRMINTDGSAVAADSTVYVRIATAYRPEWA